MAIKSFLSEGGFSVGSVGSTPIEVIDSSGNVTAVGLTVSGNLVVNGSTTTINSTTTTLDDPIFTLGGDTAPTSDDNKDRGIEFRWHTGSLAKVGFFGYDDSTGKFVFIPDATNNSEVFAGTKGTLDANIEWADVLNKPDPVVTVTLTGDVTGTANATLTDLGNGTITVATTIAADSIALGTDTTGNYVASITNGSYITGGNGGSEGAALTLAVDATSANTASKVVARDASGNFSAGVITGTRLEARNSGTTQIYLDSTTSGSKEIVFQNNGATAGYVWASGSYVGLGGGGAATSLFVTAASGNTGIGTTSPGGRLEVNFPVASGATALILRTSDGAANGTIRWQNSAAANGAAIGSNYNVSDVGALEFLNGTTTNVIFRSSGNVGIGTTAPGQKLEVNGNILAGNSVANNSISVTRTGANSSSLSLQAFTDSPAITWDSAGGYLRFIYSSTEQMRITSGGNVGIGVTSPGAKLHVAGAHADESADRAATTAFIVDTKTNGTGDGKTYIKTGWVNTGNYGVSTLAVGYYASGTQVRDVITMLGTGNVGIGTTAPTYKFEISGTAASGGVARIGSIDYTSTTVLSVAPGVVNFDAPGVVGGRFTINSSGNVGIGNVSPNNKLDVTGSIRTTDWYYVDGSGFGMYNNATGLYLSTIGNNWDISSASGQTWSGLRLYSGGKNVTWRGNFYGDSTGQGFLDSAGNWALRVDSSKRLIAYSGIANMDAGIRVSMPGGAAYSTTTSTITGAFKIKLPTARYKSDSMLRMTIKIYQYSTGQSLTFNVGGYNYNHATNTWLNIFAEQESDSNATVYTVRFGDDGTSNCIWIGETNSTWSYPQVFVSDFQAGYGGTTADWASGWAITAVTTFDTVYTSRVSAIKVTSNNIGTYGVSSITGTANQVTASASTGAVTLSLPQNIHTGATPTFSSLTLSGDVITLSGSGVSAYANSTARIYNQTGVGPTINGNSLEVRTGSSGTLALTVNSSQHSLFAGRASTGVFPGFTSAQLPQYGMGVAYGTDATSYAATGATRAPDGYTIAVGPFNNTNRYSQIAFGVGNGSVNGFSYIGGAAHGTSYLAHLIFGRTTGAASYAESMRIDGSSGNLLIGTTTDSANGKLQLATHNSSAGGIGFGTETSLYSESGGMLIVKSASNNPRFGIYDNTGVGGLFEYYGPHNAFYVTSPSGKSLILRTNGGVAALTLDSSQNATFAGNLTVSGTGTSAINNLSITPTSGHVYLTGPSAAGKFITLQNGNATGGINFRDSAGNEVGSYYQVTDAWVFSKNTTVSGNLTVSQNLIVNGTTTTVNSTVSTIKDPIVTLGGGDAGTAAASDDNKDRGIEFKWHNGTAAKTGFFGFDDSTGYFTFIPDATNTSEVFSGTQGDIQASNFRGNLIGNVTGSVATLTAGSYLTGTSFNGSTAVTFAVDATSANTVSKVVARDASGNFSVGTVTAAKLIAGNAGTAIGSVPVVINGTIGDNDSHLVIKKPSQSSISFLAWDGGTYISSNCYYENSVWVHSAPGANTNSQLLNFVPGVGVKWFTSNNSSVSWNVASDITLWSDSGIWQRSLSNTLTLNTSGTGLSGSTTYNNSGAATFTVTSNATNANTASTIVARDASGNFTAGTITAALSGNASTAATWQTARTLTIGSTGKSVNGSADVAWTLSEIGAWPTGGSWAGDFTSNSYTRSIGYAAGGGEFALLLNNSQISTLIDGSYNAYEAGGFYSSNSSTFATRLGFNADSATSLNFNTTTVKLSGNQILHAGNYTTYVGNGTLTLAVSGTGLSGSASFTANQSGNTTFTVTSNATSANTASAIVARDGSGNFAAGAITSTSITSSGNLTVTGGTITGGASGLSLAAGGTDQNITLTSSGTGRIDIVGPANAIAARIGAASQYLTVGSYSPNSAGATLGYNGTQYLGLNAFFGVLVGRTYVSNNTTAPADGMIIQGNVGIGTTTPGYKLEVNGSFAATTKSFVIKHPTKEGKKLRYGSLEGPENGVYVRGKLRGSNVIELPDYWTKLIDPESITVQLTPIGSHQKLYVEKIEDNKVYIANENLLAKAINCFFYVLAERIDVEKLQVEIDA